MLTTTTSPVRARLAPSMIGPEPEPVAKPPPCNHTITGRFLPPLKSGVNTFSTRQSSLSSVDPAGGLPVALVWGALGPYESASRTPVHGAGFSGGIKRFFPAVLAP